MKRMELKQFYRKLYDLGIVWQQLGAVTSAIRRHKAGVGTWCPITAVAEQETGTHYTIWNWGHAAKAIGLQSGDAQGIVDASDAYVFEGREQRSNSKRIERQGEIRKELLEATGLHEWIRPEEAGI